MDFKEITIPQLWVSFMEIVRRLPENVGTQISFVDEDGIRDFFGYESVVIQDKFNSSQDPADISFDITLLQTDIAQRMIFIGKRSGIIHIFTMDIDPGYNYLKNFRGGVQWFMMENRGVQLFTKENKDFFQISVSNKT